jgi:hypothetical protein
MATLLASQSLVAPHHISFKKMGFVGDDAGDDVLRLCSCRLALA